MKTRNSLTLKLSIIILSVVLFIFAVIVTFNFKVSQKLLVEDAKKDARYITKLTISQIQGALSTVEGPVDLFSKYISENKASSLQLKRIVELMVINSDKITSSFVYYFKTPGDTSTIRHYFKQANKSKTEGKINIPDKVLKAWHEKLSISKKPYWSEPNFDSASQGLTSTYVVPMFDSLQGHGKMLGLIAIEFRLKWLQSFLQKNKVYDSDYIFIISKQGKPVVMPGNRFTFDKTILGFAKELNNPDLYALGKKMMDGETGSFEMQDVIKNESSIYYYEPIPSTSWSVGVVFPKFELFGQLYSTTFILGIVGLTGFLLILIFTIVILKRQTKPLRELSAAAKEIGHGKFDVTMPVIHTHDEVGILNDSLRNMQEELKSYIKNLVKTVKEKERIEGELQVAQKIQMGYLRRDFTRFAQNMDFEISALLKPAHEVGGDFYDFFKISDNKIGIAIGDVAGKGIPAALFMSVALTLTRSGNYTKSSLANVVGKINNELCKQNDDSYFITAFFGVLDLSTGELIFCNAGHNYPYLLKKSDLFEIQVTHGPALGVIGGQKYKTGKLKLGRDDMIFLFTDGITDAENVNKQFFDKTRLEEALRMDLLKKPTEITKDVYQDIRKFTAGEAQFDDITRLPA